MNSTTKKQGLRVRVLGIETSCDETAVALYDHHDGLLGDSTHSQLAHHAYGGVVPELASRDHIRCLAPMVQQLLNDTQCETKDINGIAFTQGPGLSGALLVGASFATSLAMGWGIPSIGVHHMEGHLLAPMLEEKKPEYPFIALLISGGHTLLVDVQSPGHYVLLGESIDDAVGEAFDKTAKLLGLGYPGGAALSKLAEKGNPKRFHFPRPLLHKPTLDFSFSGLKTFALNTMTNAPSDEQTRADIARAFEDAVVEVIQKRCLNALEQSGRCRLILAGGVSANHRLRSTMAHLATTHHFDVFYPRPEFCTDNGAMIAYAGCQRFLSGEPNTRDFSVKPRWPLTALKPMHDQRKPQASE